VTRMRDGFANWAAARTVLAPPQLAGTPVETFRTQIPLFFDGAVEVTPQVEEIVLSVMRVDGDGRIHPRLSRANHLRILHAMWQEDPEALHARLRVPALAVLARAGDRSWDERRRGGVRLLRAAGAPTRVAWMDGIHDLPLQHPRALAHRISSFARTAVG